MDNRAYASPIVKAWCDEHQVCPEGRDLAATCLDLRTVWQKLDRPAWLLWFYGQGMGYADPLGDIASLLEYMDESDPHPSEVFRRVQAGYDGDDFTSFDYRSEPACAQLRAEIDCPFTINNPEFRTVGDSVEPIIAGQPDDVECKPSDGQAEKPTVAIALNRAPDGSIDGLTVNGEVFVKASEAVRTIRATDEQAMAEVMDERKESRHWYNVARFMLWGCYFGLLAGYLIACLLRRERQAAEDDAL